MRFRQTDKRSRVGLSRKDQWRLILAILSIGLIILAVDFVSTANQKRPALNAAPDLPTALPAIVGNDNLAADQNSTGDQNVAENQNVATPDNDNPTESGTVLLDNPSEETGPLGLTREQWDVFRDNEPNMFRSEGVVFYQALRNMKKLRNATLGRLARRDVAYSVLKADPEVYRGELIYLEGQLRRLTETPVPADEEGVAPLIEGWLFTEDSDVQPYRIVALGADEAIPRGDSIEPVKVRLVGAFVKNQTYASNGGTGVAPLLIAKKIGFVPLPTVERRDQLTPVLTTAISVAMVAIFGAFLMTLRRQTKRRIEFRLSNANTEGPGDIPCEPPSEFLASLELGEADAEDASVTTSN